MKVEPGVTSAARETLELIQALPLLDATSETDPLAAALIAAKAIPETEPRDAFHTSIAAPNGVKYILILELQSHRKRNPSQANRERLQKRGF